MDVRGEAAPAAACRGAGELSLGFDAAGFGGRLNAFLDEALPTTAATGDPYEWELLGSLAVAPLWQVAEEDWLATADSFASLVEQRGGVDAADLLESAGAIGPPFLSSACRAAIGRLGIEPRMRGRIGAQELVAAHWASFDDFRAAVLRLAREGSEQVAVITFDRHALPQVSGVLSGPHPPADAADHYDQQLAAFEEDMLREVGRDEAVALCVGAAEEAAEAGHVVEETFARSLPVLARALTGRSDGLMWLGEVMAEPPHEHAHRPPARRTDPRTRAKRKAQRAARKRNRRR